MPSLVRIPDPDDPRPHREAVPMFDKLVAGWLCLDFVNTVAAWSGAGGRRPRASGERLGCYDDLLAWSAAAGVIDAPSCRRLGRAARADPEGAEEVLSRAHELRGASYVLFSSLGRRGPAPPGALAVLDREARALRAHERLVQRGESIGPAWTADAAHVEAVLWPVLRSALKLLERPALLDRVGCCPGERCGWLFLDTSRGGRRRWCDMADCGNVAKVRAHRARRGSSDRG